MPDFSWRVVPQRLARVALIAVLLGCYPVFRSVSYSDGWLIGPVTDILTRVASETLLAVSMTLVIAIREINLSVGATMAIRRAVAAYTFGAGYGLGSRTGLVRLGRGRGECNRSVNRRLCRDEAEHGAGRRHRRQFADGREVLECSLGDRRDDLPDYLFGHPTGQRPVRIQSCHQGGAGDPRAAIPARYRGMDILARGTPPPRHERGPR